MLILVEIAKINLPASYNIPELWEIQVPKGRLYLFCFPDWSMDQGVCAWRVLYTSRVRANRVRSTCFRHTIIFSTSV